MGITDPFSITYGTRTIGGTSPYALHGPHIVEKDYDNFRLVFDAVITAASYSSLQDQAEALEDSFRERLDHGDTLTISLGGSTWTYTQGSTILDARAHIVKSGNQETDRGFSRAYTIVIEGELPADNDGGLRDVSVVVTYEAGRQRVVTMQGVYTATDAGDALDRYQSGFDAEATVYLNAIDNSATWELAEESTTLDRHRSGSSVVPNTCQFTRQYVELLADQTDGTRDATNIRDHRVVFTTMATHTGDSRETIHRLRRVMASYDCAVDIEQTTDLQSVYDDEIRDHVLGLFETNYTPQVFAVEDERVGYDETSKRLSATLQLIYQTNLGENVVEIAQSVTYRENRNIDYTPLHDQDEFAAEADVGWSTLERIWTRTARVVGDELPKLRIIEKPKAGDAGLFEDKIGGIDGPDKGGDRQKVKRDGWNIISSVSQVSEQWIGDPTDTITGGEQIKVSELVETVIERFHRAPASSGTTRPPITL